MSSRPLASVLASLKEPDPPVPPSSLGTLIGKSALLNFAIVATSLPVLILSGGKTALYPALAVMLAISIVLWAATFACFAFLSLVRIFRLQANSVRRRPARWAGLADESLDPPG